MIEELFGLLFARWRRPCAPWTVQCRCYPKILALSPGALPQTSIQRVGLVSRRMADTM